MPTKESCTSFDCSFLVSTLVSTPPSQLQLHKGVKNGDKEAGDEGKCKIIKVSVCHVNGNGLEDASTNCSRLPAW